MEEVKVNTELDPEFAQSLVDAYEKAEKEMSENDIRSNPHSQSVKPQTSVVAAQTHKPRVQQVATKPIKRKKESTADKFKKAFFGEDVTNVKDYVIFDVMIPALKATLSDMIGNGIEVLLFGESRGKRKKEGSSYGSYYRRRDDRDRDRDRRSNVRGASSFDDIILDSRGEAEEVLSQLSDLAIDYGQASVADLYDLVGISANFTDEKYGWFKGELRSAGVRRVRDGYLLELPRASRLD